MLPRASAEGWEANQRGVEVAQIEAARRVFSHGGIADVLALARLTETPGFLGKAIYNAGFPASAIDALIEAAARAKTRESATSRMA